ncbi:hypothetical protein PASE110613_05995 [Paenibacillus sediminis]|uniref:Apea-like HEPN domain-containing protein n=1 Tax=Paenibacillus sediminis TaxID=664909 RepID=A0ABS4H1C0_9BACL|nr:hypothetical protein [Paenibacillus sediminis]MBP1936331.1 hypothetical protein [Paenibacillus sediminis]
MSHEIIIDTEQSRELFMYFGLAVYYSQALEQQLANLIMLMKLADGKVPSEEDFSELYQRKLSSSLGQLVQEIQHNFEFSAEETAQLRAIWKQRNYIVHDYFKERIQETFTAEGRMRMIQELIEFKDQAQALETKLHIYTKELYAKIELT